MTRRKEKRRRGKHGRRRSSLFLLDDPREPIRRGVSNEPRLRRDHFAFLCLNDMKVFEQKPTPNQERYVRCPECEGAEDVVIYK